jgi:regulator of nucleoside diphosphate kinase
MVRSAPVVNRLDKERLRPYLEQSPMPAAHRVQELLERSRVVRPISVPPDVVTMNSRLSVRDARDDSVETYILTYPDGEADDRRAVSVLSPLGSALLGARIGEEIVFPGARANRRVLIEDLLYQPERSGHLQL